MEAHFEWNKCDLLIFLITPNSCVLYFCHLFLFWVYFYYHPTSFVWKKLRESDSLIILNLYRQEIDTIHSLTLSKIIRLNTGFKSAPDNIFFSTEHCSTVTNFWCIPHKETEIGNCTDIQQTLWTLRQELKRQKEICRIESDVSNTTTQQEPPRSALFYISISLALVALFFLALFLRVWIQLRRKQKAEAEKNVGHELNSRDNFVF